MAGSPPPDNIASSFRYLKSVNSGVALSPQLNLLLEAARQGKEKAPHPASGGGNASTLVWNMSRALSGVLEEEASRTVSLADSLFNNIADSVERGLGESMRKVRVVGLGFGVPGRVGAHREIRALSRWAVHDFLRPLSRLSFANQCRDSHFFWRRFRLRMCAPGGLSQVYYDAGGRRMEDAAELDHVLGKVSLPSFHSSLSIVSHGPRPKGQG